MKKLIIFLAFCLPITVYAKENCRKFSGTSQICQLPQNPKCFSMAASYSGWLSNEIVSCDPELTVLFNNL
jgi:hypothetical protein